MDTPFIYNKPVTGRNFIPRRTEASILANLLKEGENVVMYEPPRTGKDSLLNQVLFDMRLQSRRFEVVSLSLLNVRSISALCVRLGSALLRPYGNTAPEYAALVGELLSGTHFVFDEQEFGAVGNILSLGWDIGDDDLRAVLSLPYRLSRRSGKSLFVSIDDFQDVMKTEDGDKVCRTLQEVFKSRTPEDRTASYILKGSRVNAMDEIFGRRKLFWRQVERVKLLPMDERDMADVVNRGFLSGGKVIDRTLVIGVCKLFKGHPGYVMHYASICDSLSKGYMNEPVLNEALADIIAIYEPWFKAMVEDLTTFQLGLLRAIVDGHVKFSGADVIRKYSLNSSANVNRLKDALCKKEIIWFDEEEVPHITDPLFEYWVTKYFFEIK